MLSMGQTLCKHFMWLISHNHVVTYLVGNIITCYTEEETQAERLSNYVQGPTSVIIEPEFKYRQSNSEDSKGEVMKVLGI